MLSSQIVQIIWFALPVNLIVIICLHAALKPHFSQRPDFAWDWYSPGLGWTAVVLELWLGFWPPQDHFLGIVFWAIVSFWFSCLIAGLTALYLDLLLDEFKS